MDESSIDNLGAGIWMSKAQAYLLLEHFSLETDLGAGLANLVYSMANCPNKNNPDCYHRIYMKKSEIVSVIEKITDTELKTMLQTGLDNLVAVELLESLPEVQGD